MNITKKNIESLPSQCGVYLFNKNSYPLYIGKAANLKARILSHFQNAKLDVKEKLILENIDEIKTLSTDSEFKAILLEAELIKKYQPKYNVRWKDDKDFLYIKITIREKYPKIVTVRKENDGQSLYFGPFSSTRIANDLLREIRKIIPFCSQKKLSRRPCFYAKMGLCDPCPNYILSVKTRHAASLQQLYRSNIKKIINILKGKSDLVLKSLEKELKTKIKEENYEGGLKLRNKIHLLRRLISERSFTDDNLLNKTVISSVVPKRIECYDVSNLFGQEATASMVVFTNGLPDKKEYKRFRIKTVKQISDTQMLTEVLRRRLARKDWPFPDMLVVDGGKPQLTAALEVLHNFKINLPLVGIAKNPDRIVYPTNVSLSALKHLRGGRMDSSEVKRVQNPSLFNLIKHIRDESHRFAKKYHLLLRKKKMML